MMANDAPSVAAETVESWNWAEGEGPRRSRGEPVELHAQHRAARARLRSPQRRVCVLRGVAGGGIGVIVQSQS